MSLNISKFHNFESQTNIFKWKRSDENGDDFLFFKQINQNKIKNRFRFIRYSKLMLLVVSSFKNPSNFLRQPNKTPKNQQMIQMRNSSFTSSNSPGTFLNISNSITFPLFERGYEKVEFNWFFIVQKVKIKNDSKFEDV